MEAGTVAAIFLIVVFVIGSGAYLFHDQMTNKGMSTHGDRSMFGGKRRKNYTKVGSLVALMVGSLVLFNLVNKENLLY